MFVCFPLFSADFGFGTMLTHESKTKREVLGTSCWMAPEMILGRDYTTTVDIWSVGIIAQELVDGEPPYFYDPTPIVMKNIATKGRANFKNPDSLSASFKNFVKQCTIMDPNTRPRAAQLLKVCIVFFLL
jgi:serine/threonine protein kinase